MIRLNARGNPAGRKEVEQGKPVIKYINGKYQVGHIYNGEFYWNLSTLFDTWQAALNSEQAKFNFNFHGDFCWPYIQDKDGLYYSHAEMEGAYN
jgi:hypothetical protein